MSTLEFLHVALSIGKTIFIILMLAAFDCGWHLLTLVTPIFPF